jgi:hypothetical protein
MFQGENYELLNQIGFAILASLETVESLEFIVHDFEVELALHDVEAARMRLFFYRDVY